MVNLIYMYIISGDNQLVLWWLLIVNWLWINHIQTCAAGKLSTSTEYWSDVSPLIVVNEAGNIGIQL